MHGWIRSVPGWWVAMVMAVTGQDPWLVMDTAYPAAPGKLARALREAGATAYGGKGGVHEELRAELEAEGLRLENLYYVVRIREAEQADAALEKGIEALAGSGGALWVAIEEAAGKDEVAVAWLKELARRAREKKVRISLYPHAGYWLDRFETAGRLAAEAGEGVGVTFNLCHWLKVEGDVDPIPAILAQRERLDYVTVNGADGGETKAMGWDRLIQPLGQGSWDVEGFLRRLRREAKWSGLVGWQGYGLQGEVDERLRRAGREWRRMTETLEGKVMAGYQGWFRAEGDGSGLGWHHYGVEGGFGPGRSHIEMWPEVAEYEKTYETGFRMADGKAARVFSSVDASTVDVHFRWMREYGLDGVWLQRFGAPLRDGKQRAAMDRVMGNVLSAAVNEERRWGVMYDLSGMKPADFERLLDDWKQWRERADVKAAEVLAWRHRGRPLVALWGYGFHDREAGLDEWERLFDGFRAEGWAVMAGVPYYWRTGDRDAIADPRMSDLLEKTDVISPWAVGRFGTLEGVREQEMVQREDRAWCRERGIDYLPVVFPGFSWVNLEKSRGREAVWNAIPRRGGAFLWAQGMNVAASGGRSAYVAMFDEMDEGTAIFKTAGETPVGETRFLSEPGVAADHYLWLTGEMAKRIRAGVREEAMPKRER